VPEKDLMLVLVLVPLLAPLLPALEAIHCSALMPLLLARREASRSEAEVEPQLVRVMALVPGQGKKTDCKASNS